ncbi:MAG TPA: hotdog fold domain-containing protein [Gemmatimonadaceae bacterium]|nr:hotdog fold domain-containing protein [Gemmatimonadaceae bacterium]
MRDTPGARLLRAWRALEPLPGGRWLFTQVVQWMVPYTGSVRPRVEALEPGYARVSIRQRRALEQHLGSIHAIALANVAEFASGAALSTALPRGHRGIVTRFSIEFFKKARGTVTAESRTVLPDLTHDGEHDFTAELKDETGVVVARATVRWRLGPDGGRRTAAVSPQASAVNREPSAVSDQPSTDS